MKPDNRISTKIRRQVPVVAKIGRQYWKREKYVPFVYRISGITRCMYLKNCMEQGLC